MAAKFLDKILFALAAMLVAGAVWAAKYYQEQAGKVLNQTDAVLQTKFERSTYPAKNIKVQVDPVETWAIPEHQKSGPDWIYEVFTSPYIYLFRGEFVVVPPFSPPPPAPFDVGFGSIKLDFFRCQLIGIEGQDGIFWDVLNNEVVVAHTGGKIPKLDLDISSFEIKEVPLDQTDPAAATTTIRVAVATVLDTKTGAKIELNNLKREMTGAPFAVLKITRGKDKGLDKDNFLAPMKAGATFEVNGSTYRIESVNDGDDPFVEVTKLVPGGANQTKKLKPPLAAKPKPAESTDAPPAEKVLKSYPPVVPKPATPPAPPAPSKLAPPAAAPPKPSSPSTRAKPSTPSTSTPRK